MEKKVPYSYSTHPSVYLKARNKTARLGTSISKVLHSYLEDYVKDEPDLPVEFVAQGGTVQEDPAQAFTERIVNSPDEIFAEADTAPSTEEFSMEAEVIPEEEDLIASSPVEAPVPTPKRQVKKKKAVKKQTSIIKKKVAPASKRTATTRLKGKGAATKGQKKKH